MLLSMTGHGDASLREEPLNAAVEIRSVNHRHFKLNLRLPEGYGVWEPAVESLCRSHIARGSIHVTITLQQEGTGTSSIDKELLGRYFAQVQEALGDTIPPLAELLPALLSLPGAVTQAATLADPGNHWSLVERCLQSALETQETLPALVTGSAFLVGEVKALLEGSSHHSSAQ